MMMKKMIARYIIGFLSALALTGAAFLIASQDNTDPWLAALIILGLAFVQTVVQVYYFLHLGEESKPRWKTYSILFTVLIMVIIVVGSLWIMFNLNYNMGMTPEQMNQYMIEQNKKGF